MQPMTKFPLERETMTMSETEAAVNETEKPVLEKREVKGPDGGSYQFDFLVIDSPDKWALAEETKGQFLLPILGTGRSIRFNMQGINLAKWNEVEERYTLPDSKEDIEPGQNYQAVYDRQMILKQLALLELAVGQKLPGTTDEERIKFMSDKSEADLEAMFNYITHHLCAMQDGSVVESYEVLSRSNKQEVVDFTGFADWQAASQTNFNFRMQRPGDEFILEFPLKNIDMATRQAIDEKTKQPDPPQVPMRDPISKKLIQGQMVPNLKDPAWRKQCRSISQKRIVMYFEACLPFSIPGNNDFEKYGWISKRLLGDVVRLKEFIEKKILDYSSRYDFFTNGHGLQS